MNDPIIIVIIFSLVFFFTILIAVIILMSKLKQLSAQIHYNEEKNQAQLETFRAGYEKDLYTITKRLTSNEERFNDVNHLIISAQKYNKLSNNIDLSGNEFLKNLGLDEKTLDIDKNLVFVLTPFHDDFDKIYSVVSRTCQDIDLNCRRGDEKNIKGDLLIHIVKQIVRARFVIANVNGRNPNVFYELGIAHSLNKGVIIVSESPNALPFDIKSQRMVIYQTYDDLSEKLKEEILKLEISEKN